MQEEVAKQPWEDQFETVLGTDRYGARYIYFPQFLESDLRIYRHCLDNKILSTVKVSLRVFTSRLSVLYYLRFLCILLYYFYFSQSNQNKRRN